MLISAGLRAAGCRPRLHRRWAAHRPAAAAPAAAGDPALAAAEDLAAWVRVAGGHADGVRVARAPGGGGLGLVAAADLAAGDELVRLPRRCHLSYGSDARLLALIGRVPDELWGAKLALQLLAHRAAGRASPFAPYVRALPAAFAGLPLFWTGAAVDALRYAPTVAQVKKRARWLLAFARDELAPLAGEAGGPFGGAAVDANALGWALGAVTSRAFRTRGPAHPASLLPLIDMANHSFDPEAKIVGGAAGFDGVTMVATRAVPAGAEVRLSYGALPNDFLLLDYGFVVPGNPHDTVLLRFEPGMLAALASAVGGVQLGGGGGGGGGADNEEPAPLPAWKERALQRLGLAGPGADTEVAVGRPGAWGDAGCPLHPRLLAGARVLAAAREAELGGGPVAAERLGAWAAPLSRPAEVAALKSLAALSAYALTSLGQETAAEDEAAASAAGADGALALRFRAEKKRLLLEAIGALRARLTALQQGGGDGGKGKGAAAAAPPSRGGGKGFGR